MVFLTSEPHSTHIDLILALHFPANSPNLISSPDSLVPSPPRSHFMLSTISRTYNTKGGFSHSMSKNGFMGQCAGNYENLFRCFAQRLAPPGESVLRHRM